MTISLSVIPGDVLAASGKALFNKAVHGLRQKRLEQARDVLIEQMKNGKADIYEAHEVDEFVAIAYRYMRAAQEGTARINLRLLAQIIAGQKATKTLKASDFLYYADLVASLRREEIILLGSFARELKNETHIVRENNLDPSRSENTTERRATKALDRLLIPSTFSSHSELWATVSALSRTGLMLIARPSTGGPYFTLTPIFEKMNALASFENLEPEAEAA